MELIIPKARLCPGQTTQYPITGHDPTLWIKTNQEKYVVIGIDGFIVTDKNKVNGVFKKFEYIEQVPGEEITLDVINSAFTKKEIELILDFAKIMNCGFFTLIWPQGFPVGYDKDVSLIHSYTFKSDENGVKIDIHKVITLASLEQGINKLRGRSFEYGKKLKSATSNVECHLANNTKNPWPGDIDSIIYDSELKKYLAIVEFKTHNGDRPVEKEHIGKYGQEDWRRFNVLFDLIDNFEAKLQYRPKLIFIVWGTNPDFKNHINLKIDLIERNKTLKSYSFARPKYDKFSSELFEFLLKIINEA